MDIYNLRGKSIYIKYESKQVIRTEETYSHMLVGKPNEIRIVLNLDFSYMSGFDVIVKIGKIGPYKFIYIPWPEPETSIGFDFIDCDNVLKQFNKISDNIIAYINGNEYVMRYVEELINQLG